jgi:AmmeMemoRadiSam system protein A
MLTYSERSALLAVARAAINGAARGDRAVKLPPSWGQLAEPRGAFVTLHQRGELRGCIGFIEASEPLIEVVARVAIKAAREDPRFTPVTAEEAETLEVEISVMSPLTPVKDPEEIRVGVHGLILELGAHRGLLLPQVPVEYGWTREQFLDQTARKAGLPPSAWRDPRAKLLRFEAEVFGEQSVKEGHDGG